MDLWNKQLIKIKLKLRRFTFGAPNWIKVNFSAVNHIITTLAQFANRLHISKCLSVSFNKTTAYLSSAKTHKNNVWEGETVIGFRV